MKSFVLLAILGVAWTWQHGRKVDHSFSNAALVCVLQEVRTACRTAGDMAVIKKLPIVTKLYAEGCRLGDWASCQSLGEIYAGGFAGVKPDAKKSEMFLRRSKELKK